MNSHCGRKARALLLVLFVASIAAAPAFGDELVTLINTIEAESCLVLTAHQMNQWSPLELTAIGDALASLPQILTMQEPIAVEKTENVYWIGESSDALIEIDHSRRALRVRQLRVPDRFGGDPETAHRTQLIRSVIHSLALFHFDELTEEQQWRWRRFALWSPGVVFPPVAKNRDRDGYASERGMESPRQDFATFATEYFLPTRFRDPMMSVKIRLPGRWAFFDELFSARTSAGAAENGPSVRDWIDPDDVEQIELVVTTPTSSAPESLAGHLLMLIRRVGDHHDGRDSLVLSFVGVTSTDTNNGVDTLTYAWRGLTGHYGTAIQEETFGDVVQRATVLENRDVQRFELNLSREELVRFIERLWVIRNTFRYEYRFFSTNCASMLLDALNHALPADAQVPLSVPLVPPLYVLVVLEQHGRLGGAVYPEYWSILKRARRATLKNAEIEREILNVLRDDSGASSLRAEVHGEIRQLFDRLEAHGSVEVGSDELFREPVLMVDGAGRAEAYTRLGHLFSEIGAKHVGPGRTVTANEYAHLCELMLRYLMNAYDRELYLAVPGEIKDNYSDVEAIAGDLPPEFVEKQLQEVQLRYRNSIEIRSLRRTLSLLRLSLEDGYVDPSIYAIGREMQGEETAEIAAGRNQIARTHGYYPTQCSLRYAAGESGHSIGFGLAAALFSEEMGHSSLFALKQDMRMVLLSGEVSGLIGLSGGPSSWGEGRNSAHLGATVFDFQKVLIGGDVDYAGVLSHGFGITLLEAVVGVHDDILALSDADIRFSPIELRYVLNVFEVDGFVHYLNLGAGLGYRYEQTAGTGQHLIAFPLETEAKFHLWGNLENCLRLRGRYRPSYSLSGGNWTTSLSGSAELCLRAPYDPYSVVSLGGGVEAKLANLRAATPPVEAEFHGYLRFR